MTTFLEEVVIDLLQKTLDFSTYRIVMPSKRAGLFLKNHFSNHSHSTHFLPEILSIEEWIEDLAKTAISPNTELLFALYETYLQLPIQKKESFSDFVKWGQILLQDFNEIDRYLIDAKAVFADLTAAHKIEAWSRSEDPTRLIKNYIQFSKSLFPLYQAFQKQLEQKQLAYQGMVYKKASENIAAHLEQSKYNYCFIGFNALNHAERKLIQTSLQQQRATIYWDTDQSFLEDPIHKAASFLRQHQKWTYFEKNDFQFVGNHYKQPKNIHLFGVPKQYAQANKIANILERIPPEDLQSTALVLGDENLLDPLIHSINNPSQALNVTMGYPLERTNLASLFELLFATYQKTHAKGWYHQPLVQLLCHPYMQQLLQGSKNNIATKLIEDIQKNNRIHLSTAYISQQLEDQSAAVSTLFRHPNPKPLQIVTACKNLILALKEKYEKQADAALVLEHLYCFHSLFQQVSDLIQQYPYLETLQDLKHLYKEILQSETVDFEGEPLQGLQIMGMLESRNLDYETVIISGLNEGILPAGKSHNSFFPFDLKIAYELPTYAEKDAVYTYHFYRLLQRAKNIYILYNTEPDVLEGRERSRFVSQLLSDPIHHSKIQHQIWSPDFETQTSRLQHIPKSKAQLQALDKVCEKGISASALTTYVRNPIDFFNRYLLGIRQSDTVEETIASNTMGTIVHDSLEDLYQPMVGKVLTEPMLKKALQLVSEKVMEKCQLHYKHGDVSSGYNYLIAQVAIRYIQQFIQSEIRLCNKHQIEILSLEASHEHQFVLPKLNKTIRLRGFIDRIDRFDGITRIIDYKTGTVDAKKLHIRDWDCLIDNYDYSKAFQVLFYTLLVTKGKIDKSIQAGIISFRNSKSGFMAFNAATPLVSQEDLDLFCEQLQHLLLELYDLQIAFEEKEIPSLPF
ncbi:MAG: PD-(D/E)XK nuclease family protein [Flavobacteriaceae bacterium]|nr:PD-(D/E)XK nuclease family protein [Flavobacteriaceae bacterium]